LNRIIKCIKQYLNTEDKKRLFSNFLSLAVLQGTNYILPLITLPYLVRVLGAEKFGLIMFAQAFIQYFVILTDYGFNLSATREISIYRDNKEKVSKIFSSVMLIKFGLLILSFIIMSIIVFSFEKFRQDWLVYYLTFGIVIGQVLFPVWFFQGMERMKYITFLNIFAKIVFTILIFVVIHKASDYIYVPLINSLGFLVAGFLSIFLIFKNFELSLKTPGLNQIIYFLKEGWHIFISTVAISVYTISNTFILGLFTNNTIVGYYSAAEKIIKAVQGLFTPVSQTIYPYISKLLHESKEKGLLFIRKVILIMGIVSLIISILILLLAQPIVLILLGEKYLQSVIVLKIMSFLPFIIMLSNILGIQTMVTLGYKKVFSNILISAGIINLVLAFILVPLYQHVGISIAVLISEIFVTVVMFIYLTNRGINLWEGKFV
jgi:PST family polysaccharide transporter